MFKKYSEVDSQNKKLALNLNNSIGEISIKNVYLKDQLFGGRPNPFFFKAL